MLFLLTAATVGLFVLVVFLFYKLQKVSNIVTIIQERSVKEEDVEYPTEDECAIIEDDASEKSSE